MCKQKEGRLKTVCPLVTVARSGEGVGGAVTVTNFNCKRHWPLPLFLVTSCIHRPTVAGEEKRKKKQEKRNLCRLSVEMKKELLLMLLSFSCKRKGGEECNNKKERRFFLNFAQVPDPKRRCCRHRRCFTFLSFFLSFSQKYPTEQHIHTGERQRENDLRSFF